MLIEEWKDIKGYEGAYQVSNLGRVKSLNYNGTKKEKILIGSKVGRGYKIVSLSKNGKIKNFLIHRLVYKAFVGNIPQGLQVDHVSNNKTDNRLQNLQLLTPSENCKKKYIDNPNYKNSGGLPKKKIICLNNNQIYESISQASRRLNLSCGNIHKALKGKIKKTGGYTFEYIDEK